MSEGRDEASDEREHSAFRKARRAYELGRVALGVSFALYCLPLGLACASVCRSQLASLTAVAVAALLTATVLIFMR